MEDRILFGTDAGPFDGGFGRPGLGLRLLTDAGLTPLQALTAATSRSSRAMGIDGDVGSLEVGKAADVLVVNGDPTSNIGALDSVLAVYQHGRLVAGAPPA